MSLKEMLYCLRKKCCNVSERNAVLSPKEMLLIRRPYYLKNSTMILLFYVDGIYGFGLFNLTF